MMSLGSNWTLKDKKLEILANKWFLPIKKSSLSLNHKITRFELAKTPINKRRNKLLPSLRPVLLSVMDAIRTEIKKNPNYF